MKTYSWDHHSSEFCSALLCCGTVYDAAKGGLSHTRSSIVSIDQNGLLSLNCKRVIASSRLPRMHFIDNKHSTAPGLSDQDNVVPSSI